MLVKIQSIEGVQKTRTAVLVTPGPLGPSRSSSRNYKRPPPSKDWVEDTIRSILKTNPGIGWNASDLLKGVRDEARSKNYRHVIASAHVQAILKKASRA